MESFYSDLMNEKQKGEQKLKGLKTHTQNNIDE